jgi:hypothetical protein
MIAGRGLAHRRQPSTTEANPGYSGRSLASASFERIVKTRGLLDHRAIRPRGARRCSGLYAPAGRPPATVESCADRRGASSRRSSPKDRSDRLRREGSGARVHEEPALRAGSSRAASSPWHRAGKTSPSYSRTCPTPIGLTVGIAIEWREAIDVLRGGGRRILAVLTPSSSARRCCSPGGGLERRDAWLLIEEAARPGFVRREVPPLVESALRRSPGSPTSPRKKKADFRRRRIGCPSPAEAVRGVVQTNRLRATSAWSRWVHEGAGRGPTRTTVVDPAVPCPSSPEQVGDARPRRGSRSRGFPLAGSLDVSPQWSRRLMTAIIPCRSDQPARELCSRPARAHSGGCSAPTRRRIKASRQPS